MLKKIMLIVLALSVLLIAGCTSGDTTSGSFDPFVGGTQGISMEFITGSPPDEVFDNGQYPFSISVKVDNEGEYDIQKGDGFLEVKGISPDEFGLSSSDLRKDIPEISGARKNADGTVIQGQSDVVTFDNLVYEQNIAGNLPISNLRVQACYDYETESSAQLCIKEENVDGLKDDEVCLINEGKRVVNSGAPIQIANVQETSRGQNGIQISFDVTHVGGINDKWFPVGDDSCDASLDNSNLYKVEIEVDPLVNGKYSAKCSGGTFNNGHSGEVVMFNGESRKVTCSFDVGEQDADFETRVNLKLKYRYLQYISKELLIKDLGNTDE